jgi:Co/Zn/Cd efflux system component
MGKHCCNVHQAMDRSQQLSQKQIAVLGMVLALNVLVLGVEVWAGIQSRSHSLAADSIHLFSHCAVIGLSIFAIRKGPHWKGWAARLKGLLIASMAAVILLESLWEGFHLSHDHDGSSWMLIASITATFGNLLTLALLRSHRSDDVNMESTWACSKVDLLTNLALVFTAVLATVSDATWPDRILGFILGVWILKTGLHILRRVSPSVAGVVET